ncbi:MAG: hypothetical protein N3C63_08400 [Rhodocyclaceae bacterium]|nr:hypothetical protein [Rhodocyclaceae bacterium]
MNTETTIATNVAGLRPCAPEAHQRAGVDLEYAQVMGGGRVCTDARYDYPDHYQGPYLYPAKPLLDAGGLKFIKGNISIDHLLYLACVMAEYDGGAYLSRVEALYAKRTA